VLKNFDTAFTAKIKAWYSNTIYAHTAAVYNVAYNLVEDDPLVGALRFPLISIYRPSGFTLQPGQTFAARKRGIMLNKDDEAHETLMARFLVVNLPYQIDIYTKSPESLDDLTEQIMQALNLDQKITVTQHDQVSGVDYVEDYDITYSMGPSEQSEFKDGDRVYHYALLYEINNARIVNFKATPDIVISEVSVDVEGSDPDNL
jgi:hypothetical protein